MSNGSFTAGYVAGAEHRADTDDREAEGDWYPGDGYLLCPQRHPEPTQACDWCEGFAAAWE